MSKDTSARKDLAKKETLMEFICCCISCWLMSVGACLLFDAQFEFEAGIVTVLWQTLLTTLVVAVMSRKWWIPLIYLGAMVIVGIVVFVAGRNLGDFMDSATSFVEWWLDFLPEDSEWYSEQSFYLIHTLINMGVSILFFVVARVTRKAWTIALLCLTIVVCIYAFGYIEYNIFAMVFLFVGLFPMIAMEKFQGHKLFKRTNVFEIIGNRWLITVISAAICIVISLGSVFALNNDKELNIRNRFSSDLAADVQTAAEFYTVEQQQLRLTLFDLGLQSNTKHIGGSLYDIEKSILAVTDLKEPSLIKMTSFDTYNGKKWTNSFEKSYRINGPWETEQTALLSGKVTKEDFLFSKLRSLAEQKEVTITLKAGCKLLPSVGQILNFTEKTHSKNPVLFDSKGQLISYFGQSPDYKYVLNTLTYQTSTTFTPEQRRNIIEAMDYAHDPIYTDEFVDHYTELEKDPPEDAIVVLEMMDINPENPYDAAYKLAKYFSTDGGFIYTEKPPFFNKNEDIVEKLFDTKKGHCVYYSTAMISMARYLGIPSRLAAGYRTVADTEGVQVVDKSEPYCWVECYFPNMGWITFEPSPGTTISLTQSAEEESIDLEKPPEPDLQKPDEDMQKDGEEEKEPEKKFPWAPVIIPSAIILVILAYLGLRAVWAPKLYTVEAVGRRFVSTKRQAEFYWQDILRVYRGMGYKPQKGETITELTDRVCEELIYHNSAVIKKAANIIEALHYGNVAPSIADIEALSRACEMLDMEARWKMKNFAYFTKRKVFLPVVTSAVKHFD